MIRCAFCGTPGATRLVLDQIVCADPLPRPDKPTPTPCSWKLCARSTGGLHRYENDKCGDCGRSRVVRK